MIKKMIGRKQIDASKNYERRKVHFNQESVWKLKSWSSKMFKKKKKNLW
jgi:hypothetical protein